MENGDGREFAIKQEIALLQKARRPFAAACTPLSLKSQITERSLAGELAPVPIRVYNANTSTFEDIEFSKGGYRAISHVWAKAIPLPDPLNTVNECITSASSPSKVAALQRALQVRKFGMDAFHSGAGKSKGKVAESGGVPRTWCDVYSIVQNDYDDKCAQVVIMSQVYANADCVLVILSPEDSKNLKIAITALRKPAPSIEALTEAANKVRTLEYFSRAWTLQEYVLAKRIFWLDEKAELLITSDEMTKLCDRTLKHVERADKEGRSSKIGPVSGKVRELLRKISPRDVSVDGSPVTREEIAIFSVFHNGRYSSYLHDAVYSILGLLDVNVTVDYNRDFTLVWNEFLVKMLRNGKISLVDVDLEKDKVGRTSVLPIQPPECEKDGRRAYKLPNSLFRDRTKPGFKAGRVPVELDEDGNVCIWGRVTKTQDIPECSKLCFFAEGNAGAHIRADACLLAIDSREKEESEETRVKRGEAILACLDELGSAVGLFVDETLCKTHIEVLLAGERTRVSL
ncbi:hypothetical protein BJ742DRAFT_738380 [Cladochytrium replicatum]|nr:hypothetical protein BJ742DRAFT_738380 [Cladochytrium replicatum]